MAFASGRARPSVISALSSHRNAASVLPVPVGARMSAFSPLAIAGHPPSCGALGAPNVSVNQLRTIGWKSRSAAFAAGCAEPPRFLRGVAIVSCPSPQSRPSRSTVRLRDVLSHDRTAAHAAPREALWQTIATQGHRHVRRRHEAFLCNETTFAGASSFLRPHPGHSGMLQDIRYAVRKLSRTPGFTAIAAFTLALAIGATTAIFSVIDGVLLKPLPFRDPDRVVRVTNMRDGNRQSSSVPDFLDIRAQSKSYSSMAALDNQAMNLTGGSEPERVQAARVGAPFWSLLGVTPKIGRGFAPNEDTQSAARTVVLSDGLWKRRFGGDQRITGKTIALDGNSYTVIGVAPAGFSFPDRPDVWIPMV